MSQKNNYNADSIIALDGLEAVRKVPGMYIGSTGPKGVNHMLYEIVDNSVDEHLAGYCFNIEVIIHKDGSATVKDDGRGIPIDLHKQGISAERVVLTTLHAGGKFDNSSYKVSGGLHGVGSSVVNALSSHMVVNISRDGKIYQDKFERGKPIQQLKNGLLPVIGKTTETGTKITFMPDKEIFGTATFKPQIIENRLHETAYLNPGLKITYKCEAENKEIVFHEPEGIAGYIKELNKDKETITDIIQIHGISDNIEVDCAMQYVNSFDETIIGFCNNILNPDGGTHITGFKNKFTSLINSYAREIGVLKPKDDNYTGTDTRSGMVLIIAIKHPDPLFEGQTKTKLGSSDAQKAVATVVGEQFTLYFDKNLETLKKIISSAERSAKIRKNETKNKNNLLEKQKFSFDSGSKLSNCESKDNTKCEIFIVEGKSAAGSAKMARNRKYQAILPIRGKILNVQKATMDKILKNEEIKDMINAFGCGVGEGYGNDFNIDKLRYNKIIILSDADVDGSHISTLLLTFFYRFVPDLINEGHIYRAMPPLYKAKTSKSEVYLYTDEDLEKYRKTHKNFELQRYKGLGEMDADQLWETTMNPKTRFLKQIEIEDAVNAAKTTELLMGSDTDSRREFISENAVYANLDV